MKIKKKIRLTRLSKFILLVIVIIALIIVTPKIIRNHKIKKIIDLGYSDKVSTYFVDNNMYESITGIGFNKILEESISKDLYNSDNYDKYLELEYKECDNYVDDVNKFISLGYSTNEIDIISNHSNCTTMHDFTKHEFVTDIRKKLDRYYSKVNLIDRYEAYQYENFCSWGDANRVVNLNLDLKPYTVVSTTSKFDYLIIVNKYYNLSEDFEPENLILVDSKYTNDEAYLNSTVAEAFYKMSDDAKNDGITLKIRSAYRSFSDQKAIFDLYSRSYGEARTSVLVAIPGHSEHQTGLSFDVMSASSQALFSTTKEYQWMKENAYKYGFIQRYPGGKSTITGYDTESWHYRYVGVDVATKMKNENITFDEYYMLYLDK